MPSQMTPAKKRRGIASGLLFWASVLLMLVLPFGLFVSEFASALRQDQIVRTYVPVNAKILVSRVTSFKDSDGYVHYAPKVRYRYEAAGKFYKSERLMPLSESSSRSWAESVTNRYPAGKACRAFHDPEVPGKAILIRGYSFRPYFDMLEMASCLSVGCFAVLRLRFGRKREAAPAENGWFEIQPAFGERERLLIAKVCSFVWYGLGAVPAAHYFLRVPSPHNNTAVHFFQGFALLGLIPLGLMIRYRWINQNFDEAHLLLDRPVAFIGKPFRFLISQRSWRRLQINEVRVRLRCVGTKSRGRSRTTRLLYEAAPVELKNHTLHHGESLELPGELTPPPDQPPSGRDASGKFDRIKWEIRLDCKVPNAPDYEANFPVTVETAPREEAKVRPTTESGAIMDVRPIDPRFAGHILSRSRVFRVYLIGMCPFLIQLIGIGMMVSVFTVVFPDKSSPFLNLPKPQATWLFAAGAALTAVASIYGLLFPSLLGTLYLRAVATKVIRGRPDAIVEPGEDSLWVDIIPRTHWNRMMLQNASDTGFLAVDVERREIRFEGDRERYRIPMDAILSCGLEKSCYSQAAKPNAPGTWLVVVRAYGREGVREVPFAPRVKNPRLGSKLQQRAAEGLLAQVQPLMPVEASVKPQES